MVKAEKMNRSGKTAETVQKKKTEIWEGHMGTKKGMLVGVLIDPVTIPVGGKGKPHLTVELPVDRVARDGTGDYLTHSSYIDRNLLDPFRMYHRVAPAGSSTYLEMASV